MRNVALSFLSVLLVVGSVGCGSSSNGGYGVATGDAGTGGDDASTAGDDAGATGDDASTGAEGGPTYTPGAPLTATPSQWTWIPFPDTSCGDGSPAGIGVNLSTTGTRAIIYLEGGGACWSNESCFVLQTAANFVGGYSAADFQNDATSLSQAGGFFDRTATANPFKDYSYIYVPYCTGDIYGANTVVSFGANTAHFVGYANMTSFLDRIVPTFPTADRIILAGSSAGGYGAMINWEQTQNAFGSIRVDLIDDSGTFMPPDVTAMGNGNIPLAIKTWNLANTAPSDCSTCVTDPSSTYGYYATKYPDHHMALLSYAQDSVLPTYYGVSTAEFTTGLDEVLTNQFTPHSNIHAFVNAASGHVLFFSPTLATGTTTVQSWITQLVTDDAAWTTVMPAGP